MIQTGKDKNETLISVSLASIKFKIIKGQSRAYDKRKNRYKEDLLEWVKQANRARKVNLRLSVPIVHECEHSVSAVRVPASSLCSTRDHDALIVVFFDRSEGVGYLLAFSALIELITFYVYSGYRFSSSYKLESNKYTVWLCSRLESHRIDNESRPECGASES
jgi:hypothetical protein